MGKKKIIEIIIGTNNDGKLREIKDLLPKSYLASSPKDFGFKSPKENGKTFLRNSLIKAKFFSRKSSLDQVSKIISQEIALALSFYSKT